jgi:uncharacterized lipoprotein NlpE involved in copper resistance
LPFADAPNIGMFEKRRERGINGMTFELTYLAVRAHQKDSYFESVLKTKLQETIQLFTGEYHSICRVEGIPEY